MFIISNTLSVCIISKNEEKYIEKCIKSIKHIADDIVLADTGSTDNTIERAKSLGARVFTHKWNNDFSAARNISIDNAKGDWILFLDCDEELPYEESLKLKTLLNEEHSYEAYYLRLVNIIGGTRVSDAIVLRVFKNKPEYRFKGKIHEQIINSIQDKCGINSIGATQIQIYHYGYDPNFTDTDKKSKRNLEILLSYDEKSKDGYYYYVLGNEYARTDNYDKALEIYNQSLAKTNAKIYSYIYYPYLVMNIIKIYYVQKRYNDCIKSIENFRETLSNFKDMYFIECLSYIEMAKLSKAYEALNKYLNCPSGNYEYPTNSYENFHDIPKLLTDLDAGLVPHREKMLTVWIPIDEWDENIIDCIKSVNEIALEVIIITTTSSKLDTYKIQQIGGKILTIAPSNIDKLFTMANNMTRGEYILLMYPNELLSHISQIQITNLLNEEDMGDGFLFRIVNMQTENYELRLSLFKTNKKISSIEDYNKYLISKGMKPYDIEIIIHSKQVN